MADCVIKRVCGGYIVTQKWKGFLGNGDAETIKVFTVGQEEKLLSDLYGFIFENELYNYGDAIELSLDIEEVSMTIDGENENDAYVNEEMFYDKLGCDYSKLKKENRNR